MNDDLNALVYREHQDWRRQRTRLAVTRERWTSADWAEARRIADAAWDAHRADVYLWNALRAVWEQHHRRTLARFAAESRLDAGWLIGVMEATR